MKKDMSWTGIRRGPSPPRLNAKINAKIAEDADDADDAYNLAISSAREAGYRKGKGKDEADRALTTAHDAEINTLRNQVATIQGDTIAIMDREFVKGWLALVAHQNQTQPSIEIGIITVRLANAIARELSRAYDKEKQT